KTERIASIFVGRPLDLISPKEISGELGMDIQLVTSIISRLRSEGLLERVSRGKYRLRMEQTIANETLLEIAEDFLKMSKEILPALNERFTDQPSTQGGDPLDQITNIYIQVRKFSGDMMAKNLLRLAAGKNADPKDAKVLVSTVRKLVLHGAGHLSFPSEKEGP
ncbi:MAG: type IV toxin-antitoxin system AbiEi family antitoxin domain-containing protein, partial [Thermoplasmatota archaeon]